MCYRLAQEASDFVAAIGTVAGQRAVDEYFPAPPKTVPVIHFHGLEDTYAPYSGGPLLGAQGFVTVFETVPETVKSWALHNGGLGVGEEVERIGAAVKTVYGCKRASEVILWTLEDGGHTWPKTDRADDQTTIWGPVNTDISASREIWNFFKDKRLQ
jgi:polyhydroxybutyrate depolymerase